MNRLALVATIGAVLVAAILGLIYAVSKQDVDDTSEPTTQSQPATPPANATATTTPAPAQTNTAQSNASQAAPATTNTAQTTNTQSTQSAPAVTTASNTQATQTATAPATATASNSQATQPVPGTTAQNPAPVQPTNPAPAPTAAPTNTQVASAATSSSSTQAQAPTPTPAAPPPVNPSFDVVRVNPNGDAVVAGRAAPGAKITLLDNGQAIGSATADDRGEWVLLPDSAVDPGQHSFSLKAQDDNGTVLESEKEVIVVVPKPAQDIAGQPVTKPSGSLAIEVPKQGVAPTQLLNAPGSAVNAPAAATASAAPQPASTAAPSAEQASAAPPLPLSLDTIDYTQDGRAMLSGHTVPGSDLIIYLDNASLGSAKADDNGRWTFTPETKAPTGDHQVRVDMVDNAGKVLARTKVPFAQPDFSTVSLTDDTVIVQPGNSLWRIARKTYGHGIQFTVIYEANKDRIIDPNLIYPGQIFQLPKSKS